MDVIATLPREWINTSMRRIGYEYRFVTALRLQYSMQKTRRFILLWSNDNRCSPFRLYEFYDFSGQYLFNFHFFSSSLALGAVRYGANCTG